MTSTTLEPLSSQPIQIEAPAPVFNCPQCSHWIAPGTLACPECETLIYADHLKRVAATALAEEEAGHWVPAREIWRQALVWLPVGSKQAEAVVQRIALLDARLRGAQEKQAKWTKRLGPFAPALLFISKLKGLLFLLLKAKFLLSFVGFFAIYWALFGWKFGLGFSLSILIHEMGHYLAARRRGLKVDLPLFLPGMGAYVRWYAQGISLVDLSAIALAGPIFGLGVAVTCGAISRATGSPLFAALAHVSAWLNLLNLIPVFGLDGAQATFALDRTQRWLVLATALVFFGLLQEWTYLFIALGMGWQIYRGGFAEKPSTRTLVRFMLLLFTLGVIVYLFPDTTRRF